MLGDFLRVLCPVLEEEKADYNVVCNLLSKHECMVNFMPCVTFDLWPVYALQCTKTKMYIDNYHYNEMVYIVSMGAHDFFFQPMLERIVHRFYIDDSMEFPHSYGAEIDQMLLLRFDLIENTFDLREIFQDINVVYMCFNMPGDTVAHLFFILENTLDTWKKVFEEYSIPCTVFIDSHKGLGNWFHTTKTYAHYIKSNEQSLLPLLYFKGKYISHDPPEGYDLLHTVSESRPNECINKLYKTNFAKENKNV